MRIAVYGAGGVGGYFAALLVDAGHDVTIVARGAHLDAIRRGGLRVTSSLGNLHVVPAVACTAAEAPVAELVLVGVKNYDLVAALPNLARIAGATGTVLSLLNGIDAPELLAPLIPADRLLIGQCSIGGWVSAPGEITHIGTRRGIALGPWRAPATDRTRAIAAVLAAAHIDIDVRSDMEAVAWAKLIWTAGYSGVAALVRTSAGEIRTSPALRPLVEQGLREGEAVARACGVALPADAVANAMATLDAISPDARPSLLRDLERGQKLEVASLSGAIAKRGASVGIPTPFHDIVTRALTYHHQRAIDRV